MAKRSKKKKKERNNLVIIGCSLVAILSIYIVIVYRAHRDENASRFALYPDFNIEIPMGYKIHGIDVSSYQGNIYWPAVAKMQDQDVRIQFAFIKATEGLSNIDRQFKRNWQKAKEANITRGAYHYFLATKSGRMQAENFIRTVKLQQGDLPPVLDVEELYGVPVDSMRNRVKMWLQTVEKTYGVKPIIYTNVDFYNRHLGLEFDAYPLWIAHYYQPEQPRINRGWVFWQHSDEGRVNGIVSKVDFNVFNGDSLAFRNLLIH